MRQVPNARAEQFRTHGPRGSNRGAFLAKCGNAMLQIVASDGRGWDHVSVSLPTRCPTWSEMCWVKNLFFLPTEVAMQLHVAEADHISFHSCCLHLWRPQAYGEVAAIMEQWGAECDWKVHDIAGKIPLPPSDMVAPSCAKR
jgi:hypothetical protein